MRRTHRRLAVPLDGFTAATRPFIARVMWREWGLFELDTSLPSGERATGPTRASFEIAAALFFILREKDDAEFPAGKWATIQALESLLEERAR